MPYSKTSWVNNGPPAINADNLNNIEDQIEAITTLLDTITTFIKTLLDDADAAAARTTLDVPGLTAGGNFTTLPTYNSNNLLYDNGPGGTFTTALNFVDTNRVIEVVGTDHIHIKALLGSAMVSSKTDSTLASNAYYDDTIWNRYNIGASSTLISAASTGPIVYTATAAANPISWNGPYNIFYDNGPGGTFTSAVAMPSGSTVGGKNLQGIVTDTTTNLTNAAAAINTTGKEAGKQVFNTTSNRPVWATGSGTTATWVYADGTTAHTPA